MWETTEYTYDKNGNILTQKDGKGNTKTNTYNAANLPETKSKPADSKGTVIKETYTYYPDGFLRTKKDKNGNLTEYTYDGAGNLLTEKSGSMFISHTYDFAGNELTTTDRTGTTTYTYDELGRVVTKTVPVNGTITYDYDITQGVEKGCCQVTTTDPKGNVTNKITIT